MLVEVHINSPQKQGGCVVLIPSVQQSSIFAGWMKFGLFSYHLCLKNLTLGSNAGPV